MASTGRTIGDIPSDDELDAILNDNLDDDNRGRTNISTSSLQNSGPQQRPAAGQADLGIDEEITLSKPREKAPKLDEARILSTAGIPKLRRISKERLRFKGKGHEYGDIARLLNTYQFWLDDLYPRAKFADALAMVEKLGHSKRMHIMRKEWIDEGKPRKTTEAEAETEQGDGDLVMGEPDERSAETITGVEEVASISNVAERNASENPQTISQSPHEAGNALQDREAEIPDEDDLDALLAESTTAWEAKLSAPVPAITTHKPAPPAPDDDEFQDDLDALAEMEGMW